MKFSILKENLSRALLIVNRMVPVRPQLPILSNILIKTEEGQIKIMGTNLETGIVITVGAKIETEGEITVPGKLLTEFIASLPAEKVEIMLDKDIFRVKTSKVSASFNTVPVKEFPSIASQKKKAQINFNVKKLAENISKTVFAASIDEGRPILTGVKMKISADRIQFFATDGYRLSIVNDVLEEKMEEVSLVLPAKTLSEVVKIASDEKTEKVGLYFSASDNQAIFTIGDVEIISRLIDGEFPNVEKIVPQTFKTRVIFEKEALFEGVKIASLFARGASNIIKMKIDKDGVSLSANTPQLGENQDMVDAKVEGEESEIAFNFRFLLDILNNLSEKEVVLESSGPLNPGVFKPVKNGSSYLHIIMPVRLQS